MRDVARWSAPAGGPVPAHLADEPRRVVGAQFDERVVVRRPGRREPAVRRPRVCPQDVGRSDHAGVVPGPEVHQLMHLQREFVARRAALGVEDQVDRMGVVLDEEAAQAVESGQVVRKRLHHDLSASGLRDVPDQLVEVEGVRKGHGGDQALTFPFGLNVQSVGV